MGLATTLKFRAIDVPKRNYVFKESYQRCIMQSACN